MNANERIHELIEEIRNVLVENEVIECDICKMEVGTDEIVIDYVRNEIVCVDCVMRMLDELIRKLNEGGE
ncbi:MAG: hypothetical protein QW228_07455 [Candidatus Aenigmatarchaeota archaeon]